VENGKNTDFIGENGNCNGKIIQNDDGIEKCANWNRIETEIEK